MALRIRHAISSVQAEHARKTRLRIDYFPTNFVVKNDLFWYVDYECNDYMGQRPPTEVAGLQERVRS